MSDPKINVEKALAEAAELVGGWKELCYKLDRTRQAMSIWEKANSVPADKAKEIEEMTDGKVPRTKLNEVFL